MKLLVTGSAGFVGQTFLRHIMRSPEAQFIDRVVLIQNKTKIGQSVIEALRRHFVVDLMTWDLQSPWNFEVDVDTVLNLATESRTNAYSDDSIQKYETINQNLLSWIPTSGVKRVIHVSSGICDYLDSYPAAPILHSANKLAFATSRKKVEDRLIDFCSELSLSSEILRLYSFIGSGLLGHSGYAFADFIRTASQRQPIRVYGNSFTKRTYLSDFDLGSILSGVVHSNPMWQRLSIAARAEVTMGELASYIADKFSVSVILEGEQRQTEDYIPFHDGPIIPSLESEVESWQDMLNRIIREVINAQ